MVSRVTTVAFQGVKAVPVDVQVQMGPGAVAFSVVGLADKAVGESRERVRSALLASGLALPAKRIVVNLAPADLPKEGSHYDLPIALGVMAAMGVLPAEELAEYVVFGELGLDGRIAPVNGALPAAIGASALGKGIVCPAACGAEAAWASDDLPILAPDSLVAVVNHFLGRQLLARPAPRIHGESPFAKDLSDVRGQETAKRALEVAAAGGHNLLMVGPPGAGKSMLAERLPTVLPPLSAAELVEVSMVHSIAGELPDGALSERKPFRAPHHSASMAAMIGGGSRARPGEVSMAHCGVLFLDELPEFTPQVLDALREPLETASAVIARANHRVTYPARFQLVAAMNPCRCGRHGEPGHTCRRGERCAGDYQARVSGPLLDRMDIRIEVAAVSASDLSLPPGEGSAEVAGRVRLARERQAERYAGEASGVRTNAACPTASVERAAAPRPAALDLLRRASEAMGFSARGYHRILKVARTIADLAGTAEVDRDHIAEALSYRTAGRQLM